MANNIVASSTINNTSSRSSNTSSSSNGPTSSSSVKKTPKDFYFEKLIGEGSYSSVYKAKDVNSKLIFAIKLCEKKHIRKANKVNAIMREKEILTILSNNENPFFIKFFCSFQDELNLYFVMNYAENGELLELLNKVGSFDEECTRFYTAEIVLALEHLHRLKIIHRDLKPQNILLNKDMHIQIIDFGSACYSKDLRKENDDGKQLENKKINNHNNESNSEVNRPMQRKYSLEGTAQYISPEMLNNHKNVNCSSDLWALGCIIYQLTSGSLAFKEPSEYLVFKKITSLDYSFPDGFNPVIRDLVEQFLKLDQEERLGARDQLKDPITNEKLPYKSIRAHPFFKSYENRWDNLHNEEVPKILPYLPKNSNSEELRSEFKCTEDIKPGFDNSSIIRLLDLELCDGSKIIGKRSIMDFNEEEKRLRLEQQEKNSKWHRFVEGNLILKEGFINKRKGLFARKRMFLLTTGPHLYYVDEDKMIKKGEVPWCKQLRPEVKDFKNFFVHTPKRIFYLEDPEGYAQKWCDAIEDLNIFYSQDLK